MSSSLLVLLVVERRTSSLDVYVCLLASKLQRVSDKEHGLRSRKICKL